MSLQPIDPRGRPEPYRPPDREAWKAKHGVEPSVVKPAAELDADLIGVLANQARDYVNRDWSTMSAEETFRIRGNLDVLHDEIAARLGTNSLVFFDPGDGQFWIYPDPVGDA
jgi:hypothetical protein